MPIFGMIPRWLAADENNSFHSAGRSQGQKYFDFTAKLFQWRKIAKLCILER
jgi:hypothetical protein